MAGGDFAVFRRVPVFVMPHYATDRRRLGFLERTVESLRQQTVSEWGLVIVDDGSSRRISQPVLDALVRSNPHRVRVLSLASHVGTGAARNEGVQMAASLEAPFVLFQDDDDLAHPRRLEATLGFFQQHRDIDFLYSGFSAIDEQDAAIPRASIRADMLEVLENLEQQPVTGDDAWIAMATRSGFLAVTSTVAVRTQVALKTPFPPVSVSEDSHTWLRMSAAGARFAYLADIPVGYRIDSARSTYRGRCPAFLAAKVRNDVDGFLQAVQIALDRGRIRGHQVPDLTAAFCRRLAATMQRQGECLLATQLSRLANEAPDVRNLRREVDLISRR